MLRTPYCPWQSISASKQVHAAYHVWSSTAYTDSNCSESKAYYTWNLNGTSWGRSGFCAVTHASTYTPAPGYTHFGSVRCVLVLECKVQRIPCCPRQEFSASKQIHAAYHVWSLSPYSNSACSGSVICAYGLDGTNWYPYGLCATTKTDGYTHFGSVRCGFRIIAH